MKYDFDNLCQLIDDKGKCKSEVFMIHRDNSAHKGLHILVENGYAEFMMISSQTALTLMEHPFPIYHDRCIRGMTSLPNGTRDIIANA